MARLRIIGKSYVLDWRDVEGTRHRDPLGRVGIFPKDETRRILRNKQLALQPGHKLIQRRAPLFDDFAKEYVKWHALEFPTSHYRIEQILEQYLIPAFSGDRLDEITPKRAEEYKRARGTAETPPRSQTLTKEIRTLKAILNKAVEWKDLEANPIARVVGPKNLDSKPPRFFTAAELARIYAACRATVNAGEGPQPNPLHAHWWRLYANTGLRRAEGLMLRWDWIGREAMKILSTDKERTKSGKWREIPLTAGAQEALEGLPRDGAHVLPRISLPSLSRAATRDIARADVEGGSLHTFRHTYCSHLVMAGVPLRTVQQLAGHSTIAVTERYAHLTPDHLAGAGRAISL